MDTPICDFVKAYQEKGGLRLHMPGHKGRPFLGMEGSDITEIAGADELYRARGIIRRSEENAASLFGAGKTVYSAEGSSLCIRAMVFLALLCAKRQGKRPVVLAGRNAHKAFLSAAALLDADVRWLHSGDESSLISCGISADQLERTLQSMEEKPAAIYVTSPDYLGHMLDIAALSRVCHRHGALFLVDNAHGAYLKFLPDDRHPISLGADLCCDSAHKTLPVLTGGAYLHIAKGAPEECMDQAEHAMALFASSSPSYLILQSLDRCNAYLADGYRDKLAICAERIGKIKKALMDRGWELIGEESLKMTLAPKSMGYTGDALHDLLRGQGMECEFSDPDFLTAMLTPETDAASMARLEKALLSVPQKTPVVQLPPPLPRLQRAMSIREAMLGPSAEIPVENAAGRVLAGAPNLCPPCVPIAVPGEVIDPAAILCFRYYGIGRCRVAL